MHSVVIIGGGVLGVSLAYHLSTLQISCIVLERETTAGAHASGKNAGMLRQLYRNPQLTDWATRSVALWPEAIREKCFRRTGSLVVDRLLPRHHDHLFEQREYRAADTQYTRPAIYTESDGLLDSPAYVQLIKQAADKQFSEFKFGRKVTAVVHTPHGWEAHCESGECFFGAQLVNAAGAWVNDIIADRPQATVRALPFARHLFVMRNWPAGYMPEQDCGFFWDEHRAWYMRKWDQTSRLVSVCEKIAASSPDNFVADEHVKDDVAAKLLLALPTISKQLTLAQSWHCFRTYTDDQLPIWGWDQQMPSFFWLAAFGGFGMSTSFAATHDAALALAGKPVPVQSEHQAAFSPSRVQINLANNTAYMAAVKR